MLDGFFKSKAVAVERLSQLCTDFPEILELDVNPLLVKPEGSGAVAIDARLALAG